MRRSIQRRNRNRKVLEIRSDSLLGDYVSVLQDCTSAHITRYPKEITMYQSDNTRNMLKRSLGSFCMPGTLSALKLQAQLVRAAYPTTSESTSTRNLACNSGRATITREYRAQYVCWCCQLGWDCCDGAAGKPFRLLPSARFWGCSCVRPP